MAFYRDDDDDEGGLDQSGQGIVQTGPQSGVISGQGGGGAQTPQQQSSKTPDKSGNFVGISNYIEANKPQAAKLGDQTAGVINASADQARQGVASLQGEAQEKIKPVNPLDPSLTNKISTAAETLTPEERAQAKQVASAQYKGPTQVTDLNAYQAASDAQKTASSNIDNSDTEQGRMNLISQVNSKPRTQGMNVFDNTLLQAGGGREKLQQAALANQDVKGGLDQASQAIQGQIGRLDDPNTPDIDESAGAMGTTAKAQADAFKQIQDALTGWKSGFTPKISQAQQQLIDMQNKVTQDLGDNQYGLDQETMELFGLNEGQGIFGLNLSDYLNPANPNDINAANVASQEDYARYAALADLAGEQDLMLNPEDASKAGTAPSFGANKEKLLQDLAAAQSGYQSAYGSSRTGVLDRSFLSNPNSAKGYSAYDGAKGLQGMNLANATPQEIETTWLPALEKFAAGTGYQSDRNFVESVKKSLAQWKQNQKVNNTIKRNA